MDPRRLELQTVLENILGSRNVYFQPPTNIEMKYPCIVYFRDTVNTEFANNTPYNLYKRYQITYISSNPDSDIPTAIARLEKSRFDRYYTAKNLHHSVFALYF